MQPELELETPRIHILSQKVMLKKHPKIYTEQVNIVKSAI